MSKEISDPKKVPNHYDLPIQPIEYIMQNKLDYCSANIVKYATRWDKKGQPREDLKKIIHYAEILYGTIS
jgi:hypothetical protein